LFSLATNRRKYFQGTRQNSCRCWRFNSTWSSSRWIMLFSYILTNRWNNAQCCQRYGYS